MSSHLFKYRLKPDCEEDIEAWRKYAQDHREEILQTLAGEEIIVEDAFIERVGREVYLYYYVRTPDLQKALKAFSNSTNAVDEYQKAFFEKVLDTRIELEKVLGLELPG